MQHEPFCTSANHLARAENQGCCTWVTDSHDNSSKPFWIVLSISCMQCNLLQVQFASQIDSAYNISTNEHNANRLHKTDRRQES